MGQHATAPGGPPPGVDHAPKRGVGPGALVVGACLVALAVRVIGLANDLPDYGHFDEQYIIRPAYHLGSLVFETPSLHQPGTLQMFLTALAFGLYYVLALGAGVVSSVQDFKALYASDPTGFYVAARLVVVAFAVATVWIVYRLARRLGGPWAGVVAAAVVALMPMHVVTSQRAMKDVPIAFFAVSVLLACDLLATRRRRRDYIVAGALLGCAMAVKYSAIVLVVPIAVAHWLCLSREPRAPADKAWRALGDPRALLAAGVSVAVFAIACPYMLIDTKRWWTDLMFEVHHQGTGHFGYEPTGNGLWFYLHARLARAATWPVLGAALAGIVIDVRRRRRTSLVLLAFLVAYWLVVGTSSTSFGRYCLPHLPLVAVYAGVGLVGATQALVGRTTHRWARAATVAVLACLGVGSMLLTTTRGVIGATRLDSRIQACRWIGQHTPPDARWLVDHQGPKIRDPAIRIVTGVASPFDDILQAVADRRIRFAALSGYTRRELMHPEMLRRYPHRSREYVRLLRWLDTEATVLKVFPGRSGLGRGPQITIYRIDPDRLRGRLPCAGTTG